MHIRKTDLDLELGPKKRSGYGIYYRWVESRPIDEPVFLITDDPKTQNHFIEKYGGGKIKTYKIMNLQNNTNPSIEEKLPLAIDHRFTTLDHAIIDIVIAAHGRDFRSSPFSSVSDLVKMFNLLHRWRWCDCTVRGC